MGEVIHLRLSVVDPIVNCTTPEQVKEYLAPVQYFDNPEWALLGHHSVRGSGVLIWVRSEFAAWWWARHLRLTDPFSLVRIENCSNRVSEVSLMGLNLVKWGVSPESYYSRWSQSEVNLPRSNMDTGFEFTIALDDANKREEEIKNRSPWDWTE